MKIEGSSNKDFLVENISPSLLKLFTNCEETISRSL